MLVLWAWGVGWVVAVGWGKQGVKNFWTAKKLTSNCMLGMIDLVHKVIVIGCADTPK